MSAAKHVTTRWSGRSVDWDWSVLLQETAERFMLKGADGGVLALWTAKPKLLALSVGNAYRLDYFEIDPTLREGVLGYYAFCAISARALEFGASCLVLGAIPGTERFYGDVLDGTPGKIDGWTTEHGLLPYFYDQSVLRALQEDINGQKITSKSA